MNTVRALPLLSYVAPLLLILLPGCWISENACAENQEFTSDLLLRCVCVEGHVIAADGKSCVPCGEHALVVAGQCQCEQGYVRATPNAACEEIPEGTAELGGACNSDEDCAEPYGYCAGGEAGYCTSRGCMGHSDCAEGWYCEDSEDGAYCERPPTGLAQACASDADCAEYEANYCEPYQTKTCQVVGCAEGETTCHGDWACCDFRGLFGVSMCVAADALDVNGMCPGGVGEPVTP